MDKTVYFNEARGLEVLRDGPSVWVKQEGKSGRRIPVRLVGRAVIIGNVRLDAGIITLFADNDIPVIFMNRKGEEAAVTIPFNHHLPKHHEEQKIFLYSEKNTLAFKTWLFSQKRKLQINTIKRLSEAAAEKMLSSGFRDKDYRLFISRFISGKEDQYRVVKGIVSNLIKEMVVESLIKADLEPHTGVLNRRHNFGLALDICQAVEPEADLQSIGFLKACHATPPDSQKWNISGDEIKDIAQRFENKRRIVHETIEMIIDELFRLMREMRL
jgi:hypothetical protein